MTKEAIYRKHAVIRHFFPKEGEEGMKKRKNHVR